MHFIKVQQATSGNPVPNELNVAFLTVGAVSLVFGAFLLSQFGSSAFAFDLATILICLIFVPLWWPYGALLVLLAASVMPYFALDFKGWNVRPEHFAVLLVLTAFLCRKAIVESQPLTLMAPDFFVIAYIVWNYAASAMTSPDPKLTLRWALLNNVITLPYFLIRLLVRDKETLRRTFKVFVIVGIGECAFAIIAFVSWRLLGTSFGVDIGQYASGFSGIYGTQYEPNLLGSYAACFTIMLLVLYFLVARKPQWALAGAAIALAAMLVSLSRAAFLAFALVSLVLLFLGALKGRLRLNRLLPLGLAVTFFAVPIAFTIGNNLGTRFADLSSNGLASDADTMARFVGWAAAFEDIQQHPVTGNGTSSFQLLADAKQLPLLGDRPWVGNSFIRIWHDTGIVGLILFGLIVAALAKQLRNVVVGKAVDRNIIIALSAGCLVYAIAFMSTDGTMLSFFWIHLGLLAAACSVFGKASEIGCQADT